MIHFPSPSKGAKAFHWFASESSCCTDAGCPMILLRRRTQQISRRQMAGEIRGNDAYGLVFLKFKAGALHLNHFVGGKFAADVITSQRRRLEIFVLPGLKCLFQVFTKRASHVPLQMLVRRDLGKRRFICARTAPDCQSRPCGYRILWTARSASGLLCTSGLRVT